MAAITRASTCTVWPDPTGSKRCSSITLKTLAWVLRLMSPTSSKNSVPPSAKWNLPAFAVTAPGNAPLTCPNNSLSIRSSGMVAQLISTNLAEDRMLWAWIARATNALPVPLSPKIRTRPLVGAISSICCRTAFMGTLSPRMRCLRSISANSDAFCASRLRCSRALRTATVTFATESGFSKKSCAPSLVARTALSTLPWPEIITTTGLRIMSASRMRSSVSSPSMPGSQMSSNNTPYTAEESISRQRSPLSATSTA